jgi:hypothetical protein
MLCKNHNTPAKLLLAAAFSLLLGACGLDDSSVSSATGTVTDTSAVSTTTTSNPTSTTSTGAFSLSWTAPVSRTDGSPLALSEIAGYRVHYGKSQGNYTNHVNITNGSLQSATLTGIPVGTYYVVMSTYDDSGIESSYSAPVIKQAF